MLSEPLHGHLSSWYVLPASACGEQVAYILRTHASHVCRWSRPASDLMRSLIRPARFEALKIAFHMAWRFHLFLDYGTSSFTVQLRAKLLGKANEVPFMTNQNS